MDNGEEAGRLIVYGHDYCTLAWLMAEALEKFDIPHEWRDIYRGDARYKEELRELAGGNLSVPTVVFPDGTVWVEPHPDRVLDRLGIERPGLGDRIKGWLGL
ncbi:MAG: hypothetical protein M3220_12730 [Chloroflexota bacterium]|nr:hypothetical protein [Chloroflexota bacterium]